MTERGSEDVWLGIDVGTQSVRCLAVTATGAIVSSGSHGLTGTRSGDRHEQDPHGWWEALAAACRQTLREVHPDAVRGLSLCATSGTILLTDTAGRPLTAGLMYDDARARKEAPQVIEGGAALWETLGYRPQPSWALPKLLWLLRHADPPGDARLAHQADYLTGLLVGRPTAADASHALKTGYDLVGEHWPTELLDGLDVPAEMLPEVVRPGTTLGQVSSEAAEATGIPAGTPVTAGMTDGCAALLGSGALTVGSWNAVLGTTLVLKGVTEQRLRDPLGVVYSHRGPGDTWLPGGASSSGAGVLSAEFGGRDLDELTTRAAERSSATAVTYPLTSRGERFPFVAPDAEPFTLGEIGDEVDRFAALLRGVAFVERLCFDYLELLGAPTQGAITLTGGGARNRYWCQLRADTLGRTLTVPEEAEPAVGMAILARAGNGSLAEAADDLVRPHTTYEPQAGPGRRYREGYRDFVDQLRRRGWLSEPFAEHALVRSTR